MGSRIPKELAEAFHRGATIVTPHERAARAVRAEWDLQQRLTGQRSWETPKALSWRAWTTELWHLLQLDGEAELTLLNPTQERHLWTEVLEQSAERSSAAALFKLAAQCIDAHRRLESYVGDAQHRATRAATGRPFSDWLQQVQERCRHGRLLPSAELDRALARRLRSRSLAFVPSHNLVLFGFAELAPAQQTLCSAWRDAGGHCDELASAELESAGSICAAQTENDELRQFALWATARLGRADRPRLALIVPDLDQQREEVEAVLRETLSFAVHDRPQHPLDLPEQPVFEFSLGRSLSKEPLIQAALEIVRWTQGPLPLPNVTRLLLSPHFALPHDHRHSLEARSQLDRRLRRAFRLRPEASVSDVLEVCIELHEPAAEPLRQTLQALVSSPLVPSARAMDGQLRPAGSWVAAIRSTLAGARWGHGGSSYNFQLSARWEHLLDEIATLDLLDTGITLARLLAVLQHQTEENVFAPESRDAPVQVLGPLEAAGQQFDALWVTGCNHLRWPPERTTSSLLPLELQRGASAPGADRQRERHWAALLTTRLAHSAPEVVFSFARQSRDAVTQHLSPLIDAMQLPTLLPASDRVQEHPHLALERCVDSTPIAALASKTIEGGARVLELQAACGFRAFAELSPSRPGERSALAWHESSRTRHRCACCARRLLAEIEVTGAMARSFARRPREGPQ